jgi:hypothetical protein
MTKKKCHSCKNDYPAHLIQTFVTNNSRESVCPLCALIRRNEMLGMPIDTPFHGEMANALFEEAFEYARKQGWMEPELSREEA